MSSALDRRIVGLRKERILGSKQFLDGTFRNHARVSPGLKPGSTLATMGEFFFGGQHRTPLQPLPSVQPIDVWRRPADSGLRATWLGHSTVLVEIDGLRVLTDPVWGERASPTRFAGPKRFQPVPIAIEALPPLDAVIISHDHYDHLCHESVLRLAKTGVPFFTSLGVGARLEDWGIASEQITELDWWESTRLDSLTISAAPSQHFSGRGMGDRNRTLWSSFVVRGPQHAFFFSGDTGLTDEYAEIRSRLGPFDLVMLEVGAFHPSWGDIHLGPENSLAAHALLGGGAFLPVHWGTFNLAIHAWDQPAEALVTLASPKVPLLMPRLGEPVEPAHHDQIQTWWRAIAALENRKPVVFDGPIVEEPLTDPID